MGRGRRSGPVPRVHGGPLQENPQVRRGTRRTHEKPRPHVHRGTGNRNQRHARRGRAQGQSPHRRILPRRKPLPPRRHGIPDADAVRRRVRRHMRPRGINPHRFGRAGTSRRTHACAPHQPPDAQPLVLGAQRTRRPASREPQHAARHRRPLVPAHPRKLQRQKHRRERRPRQDHRTAHLRTMGRNHRPQTPSRARMGAPHVALLPKPRTLPAQSAYHAPLTTPAMRLTARKEN